MSDKEITVNSAEEFFDEMAKMDKITEFETSFDVNELTEDGLLNKRPYSDKAFFNEIHHKMLDSNASEMNMFITFDDGVKVGIKAVRNYMKFKCRYFGMHKFIHSCMKKEPLLLRAVVHFMALFPTKERRLLELGIRERIWGTLPYFDEYKTRKALWG